MKGSEIRQKWIEFFEAKQHKYLPSASLVPDNPTLLLNNAGMVPFVPYFLGQKTPENKRAVTIQKCVRVGGKDSDLENIGKTPRHLTFFEMMGNFSFGDYFKEDVIPWAWELITKVYGFKIDDLSISIFEGDDQVPCDTEAMDLWIKAGVPKDKIRKMSAADNFWGPPGGVSGPCGPCSEIYYHPTDGSEEIEIWNLVFMEYEKLEDGSMKKLAKPNIDTGLGLERLASILQNKSNVFETDLLKPIVDKVQELSSSDNKYNTVYQNIVADHIRCTVLLIADGIKPSNLGRGYIVRMLLRRALRFAYLLGADTSKPFIEQVVPSVCTILVETYPEINNSNIINIINKEEELFSKTLQNGLARFKELIKGGKSLSGDEAFDLYATYGFPIELTLDLAEENNIIIDIDEYNQAKETHSQVSNKNKFKHGFQVENLEYLEELETTQFTGYFENYINNNSQVLYTDETTVVLDQTSFYAESGGQVADTGLITNNNIKFSVKDVKKVNDKFVHTGKYTSESKFNTGDTVNTEINIINRKEIQKHHTATHLLQSALRQILGDDVKQAGSQVSSDKLRFDFTFDRAVKSEELNKIEELLNSWIEGDFPVKTEELDYDDAINKGAMAFFDDKYDDKVRVLSVYNSQQELISMELCGGTHVKSLGEIGKALIIQETSIASGVRRIEMLVGSSCLEYLSQVYNQSKSIAQEINSSINKLPTKIQELINSNNKNQKEIKEQSKQLLTLSVDSLASQIEERDNIYYLCTQVTVNNLRQLLDQLATKLNNKQYILFAVYQDSNKLSYACKSNSESHNAKEILSKFASQVNGSGGGKEAFAQGGAKTINNLNEILKEFRL